MLCRSHGWVTPIVRLFVVDEIIKNYIFDILRPYLIHNEERDESRLKVMLRICRVWNLDEEE